MTLPELKALAQAATPGPWYVRRTRLNATILSESGTYVMEPYGRNMSIVRNERDAPYLAALSPERVLQMIAVIEAADAMHANKAEQEDIEMLYRSREEAIARADALQAKVDALMLEYCPEEMTPEQIAEWGKHQR